MEIKRALSALVDEIPAVGEREGWERIERMLYTKPRHSIINMKWRTGLASAAVVVALLFAIVRIPAVNAWRWKVLFGARNLRGVAWQTGASLDSILSTPYGAFAVGPESSEWSLQAVSLELSDGVTCSVALRYKGKTGAVFTLRETPSVGESATPAYDPQDPSQFLLKVGNSNVAIFLPGSGFVSASWVTRGLKVEIWGSGDLPALVRLIEDLVLYPPEPPPGKPSTT
jgi:hypothetical protein